MGDVSQECFFLAERYSCELRHVEVPLDITQVAVPDMVPDMAGA